MSEYDFTYIEPAAPEKKPKPARKAVPRKKRKRPIIPYEKKSAAYRAAHKKRPKKWRPKRRMNGTFKAPKFGKYNANGRRIDGHWFPSAVEGDRYEQLVAMQKAGKIDRLELQPKYRIIIEGKLICEYRADFRYLARNTTGSIVGAVIEDVKGMITPVYMLKKKMFEAHYQQDILEIPGRRVKDLDGKTGIEARPMIAQWAVEALERKRNRQAKKRREKKDAATETN